MKQYFKGEAYWMIAAPLVLIALALVAVTVVPWVSRQLSIDRCLDAGGRFNYEIGTCEGARSEEAFP